MVEHSIPRGVLFGVAVGFCIGLTTSYMYLLTNTHYLPSVRMNYEDSIINRVIKFPIRNNTEDFQIRDQLAKISKVRVLCWILTSPQTYASKAKHVVATWGRRCDKLLLISSKDDPNPDTIKLNVNEGRDNLWAKTRGAFKHIYENHLDDAEWFLKADDDTYFIMENLRYLLSAYNHTEPMFFGRRFKPYTPQGYMSGGAGYVLSKKAVQVFIEKALPHPKCSPGPGGAEDAELGICLSHVNVTAMDSRDEAHKGRFFLLRPEDHATPNYFPPDHWIWKFAYYNDTLGPGQMSDYAISFHYISADNMYAMEYFVYHLRPITSELICNGMTVINGTEPPATESVVHKTIRRNTSGHSETPDTNITNNS